VCVLIKIYSLEDDINITNIIEDSLKNAVFYVKSFSDYRLFFDEIKKDKPSLILLDLSLPLISGEEVLKYIKGNLALHNIPVIVLSGKLAEHDIVSCLDFGADDYMVKPFSILELISRINFNNDYPCRLITALGYWLEDPEEIIDYINSHKNYYLTIVDYHY
jgi:two-component system alkaline phosphatase synthesis response regulator PhoP